MEIWRGNRRSSHRTFSARAYSRRQRDTLRSSGQSEPNARPGRERARATLDPRDSFRRSRAPNWRFLRRTPDGRLTAIVNAEALTGAFAEVYSPLMENVTVESRPSAWKTRLAFGIIYFVWGSTFLAIRVGVHEVPPLLFAAMRFGTAGLALLVWTIAKGERMPRRREWLSLTVLAALIFLCDYGLLFWAEQRVPSGIAAVMLATIPAFMALSEIIFLR